MDINILEGYDYPNEIVSLFKEYTNMLIEGDNRFKEYLDMQNYDNELKDLSQKYGRPYGRLYIAFCGSEAVGCIALKKNNDTSCELKRLYVKPQYRKNKLGEKLVKQIISDAREIGYSTVFLDTLPFLEAAIYMYKKYGFVEIERYNDSPLDTSIYMKLDIK